MYLAKWNDISPTDRFPWNKGSHFPSKKLPFGVTSAEDNDRLGAQLVTIFAIHDEPTLANYHCLPLCANQAWNLLQYHQTFQVAKMDVLTYVSCMDTA